MDGLKKELNYQRERRIKRVRSRIFGTAKRPRLRFTDSQIEYEIVSLDPSREVQVYIGHLAPGAVNTSNPVGHGTSSEECLFILSGRVVVSLKDQRSCLFFWRSSCLP